MKTILTCIFLSTVLLTQTQNGNIFGKVLNAQDEGIRRATITVQDSTNAKVKLILTDSDGSFNASPLLPGKYNLQISANGYVTQSITGVLVKADRSTFIVDVRLKKKK